MFEYLARLTPFMAVSWVSVLLSAGLQAFVFHRWRYLYTKPSMLVLGFYHLFLQWPAAVFSEFYESFLPDPWTFAVLIHGFVLLGLIGSMSYGHAPARDVWRRITAPDYLQRSAGSAPVVLSAVLLLGLTGYYLSVVPISQTGLYAIFLNPLEAGLAREESLKLLSNRIVAYAYLFMALSVAPVLTSQLYLVLLRNVAQRRLLWAVATLLGILSILVIASLSGARGFSVNLLLVMVVTWAFLRGLPFRPVYALGLLALILAPAALISILREGREARFDLFVEYLLRNVADRVFVVPMNTGSWYVHWYQTYGPFGVSAVPKLAGLLGVPGVEAANIVGLRYANDPLASVSAVAGYVFSYFGYFGWISLPVSFAGLWFADIAVLALRKLPDALLLPTLAALTRACLSFTDTDYTTIWVTQGFGIILLLSLAIGLVMRRITVWPAKVPSKVAG